MVEKIIENPEELMIVQYDYGSFVYGTNDEFSDKDYICVFEDTDSIPVDEFQTNIEGNDYTFIKESKFVNDIKNHDITALECIFLPSDMFKGDNDRFLKQFNYDENKLRASISSICSNSFVKAKKKLIVEKDFDLRKSKKSLFHSIRIFDFGIQIAKYGKIVDYKSVSNIWNNDISKETSVDWSYYQKKYKPIYNKYHSQFVKLAKKNEAHS